MTTTITPWHWARTFPTAARDLTSGAVRCSDELLGVPLRMSDGRTYVPFRHTVQDERKWSRARPPAVLHARFHLGVLPARRRSLHALFRVVCIVTTPFFVGIRGFRSKLWMVDPRTGDFAGLYEWDDLDSARAYAVGLSSVLRLLSTPGSVSYEVRGGMTVARYLELSARRADTGAAPGSGGRAGDQRERRAV